MGLINFAYIHTEQLERRISQESEVEHRQRFHGNQAERAL